MVGFAHKIRATMYELAIPVRIQDLRQECIVAVDADALDEMSERHNMWLMEMEDHADPDPFPPYAAVGRIGGEWGFGWDVKSVNEVHRSLADYFFDQKTKPSLERPSARDPGWASSLCKHGSQGPGTCERCDDALPAFCDDWANDRVAGYWKNLQAEAERLGHRRRKEIPHHPFE